MVAVVSVATVAVAAVVVVVAGSAVVDPHATSHNQVVDHRSPERAADGRLIETIFKELHEFFGIRT